MPFKISTALRTFTLLMRQCIKAVRQRWKVTAVHYLDDLLFLHRDREYLRKATNEIVHFLSQVGWVINQEKGELEPKQLFRYLGWEGDSRAPSICLPQDRVKSPSTRNAVEQQRTTTARRLARLIGALSATRLQYRQASLHLRTLNSFKNTSKTVKGWNGETVPLICNLLQNIGWRE
jgi:hypothetical protein